MSAFPDSTAADSYRVLADRIARDCGFEYPIHEEPAIPVKNAKKPESACEGPSRIPVSKASFPAPFAQELEFNPPVHETWNIVHIGMLMPQAHQIYICSDNCMRGVVMTAAEMNAIERFSCVVLEEKDMHSGNLEEITLEGVTDVLEKIRRKKGENELPKAVLVFPVCLHHFMGCDLGYVYKELERILYRAREAGISVPIIAGIMPITSPKQLSRSVAMSGTDVPQRFRAIVDYFGESPAAMTQAGIIYATEQIIDLVANGIRHIHVYTMNKPEVAEGIKRNLSEILR